MLPPFCCLPCAGQHGTSLAAADACVEANPSWHKGHSRRAEALFELQRHPEAVRAYEAALTRLAASDRAPDPKEDRELRFALKLAKEAAAGGIWFRQLLTGRDIAVNPTSPAEELVFGAAKRSRNFIYLGDCPRTLDRALPASAKYPPDRRACARLASP